MGGGSSNSGAKDAAKAQEKAAQIATDEQKREYNLTRYDLGQPRVYGSEALRQLASEFGLPDTGPIGYDPSTGSVGVAGTIAPSLDAPGSTTTTSKSQPLGGILGGASFPVSTTVAGGSATPGGTPLAAVPGQAGQGEITSGYKQSPGYQFALQQGLDAITSNAASKGLLHSGANLKALSDYGQGTAARDYYGNYIQGLQSLAGVGQSATNTAVQAGQQTANNVSDLATQAGNARASAYAGQGGGGFASLLGGAAGGASLGNLLFPAAAGATSWGGIGGGALGLLAAL